MSADSERESLLSHVKYFWLMVIAQMILLMNVAQAGPITFNSALPVSEGVGILRTQFKLVRKTGDVTAQQRNLTITAVPLVMAYGFSSKLALFGVLPYVDKRMDITIGNKRIRRQTQGLGDSKLFARYTVYQVDNPGDTFRIAPFVGLKMPTGSYKKQDALGFLPRTLQVGSGSWDSFAGIAMTRQTLDWEFDAATSYQVNTKASGFEFGDEARVDGSFQYRIVPDSLDDVGVPAFIYAVLESNLIWNGKNKLAGATNMDSGGTTWNLVPGLQYVTRRYVLETAIQIPVMQQLNGSALETDWVWTAGFRWNF
ncbi:MAG: transporter [Mariprofundaceae bacterium]|nr:transporter [Mariprofundaceae bacterium]